jgi:hypothetical protein
MTFHLVAIPGVLALLCAWSLAATVLLTGPGLRRDRLLALFLFVDGTAWGTGSGILYLLESPTAAWYSQAVFIGMLLAMPGCALAFIGTLPTPLVAPFNSRFGLLLIAVLTVAAEVYYLAQPARFIGTIVPAWYASWDADLPPITVDLFNLVGLVGLVSLAASISAWLRSPHGSAARRQARAFALAFGVHDVGIFCAMFLPGNIIPPPPSGHFTDVLIILGVDCGSLALVLLLAYGILKVQLFDIDLRIKRGIRRSTVAAIFLAGFLIVEQLVQNFFTGRFGILLGAVAAGLMLFAFGPIRRFAEALANGAMPAVAATPEYVVYRKLEVYRAALEGLYADALVSDKERAMLDRLRIKLGIEASDARAMEEDVSREAATAWS